MKRSITLLSLFLMLTTVFVACDKDDDSNPTGLAGTWEISKIIIDKMDNKDVNFEITNEMLNPLAKQKITFNADGTVKFGFFTAKWELKENDTKLLITYPSLDEYEADSETLKISIQNDTFIISSDDIEYTNSDKDDEGEFSFTELDEKFKTNIKDQEYIEVSSEEHFSRQ
ncbi:lipocalin-like domain-containing protein [Ancylomarina sp. YFZ004]